LEEKAARARLAERKKRQTELRDKYRQIMGDDADQVGSPKHATV
jgi:hypothetical protein